MAELVLSPLLSLLIHKLIISKADTGIDLYFLNQKQKKELPETIKKWKEKLLEMEAVLSDAEQQQFRNKSIQKWLNDLQDWAYDLEDVLDEFATNARLRELKGDLQEADPSPPIFGCSPFNKVQIEQWLEISINVPINILSCIFGEMDSSSDTYPSKIEGINNRLEEILTRVGPLNLMRQTLSSEEQQEDRADTSSLARVVYGRDDEKQKIIQRLLSEDEEACSENYGNYTVVPIVGQGGIGKTTLAQSVYNDEQVKAHYDVKAWVCVSDVFDVKQITTAIISSATNKTHNFSDLNQAQEKLKRLLNQKRFLFVLDDIWSDEYNPWEQLQLPFQAGSKGSRVLITTRLKGVANNMLTTPDENPIMYLQVLSDDECWLIFKQHALISDDPIEVRSQVIRLSKGLPLAAKALGGFLKKKNRRNWSTILSSNIWSEEGGVLPALRLSYYHLPHHLKRMFAYCSIFPKDYRFFAEDIVLMWMAEGFLPESEWESMENKGHSYFDDLVSRSLFEPISFPKGCFMMHDLIHDLAQWAAGDVCSRLEIINKSSIRTRYLSISKEFFMGSPLILEKVGGACGHLRTLAFISLRDVYDCSLHLETLDSTFQQLQCVRVLCMARMNICELPNSIGDLKYLRYLDLSHNTFLSGVPKSMSKLCNLQTLLLRYCINLRDVFDMQTLTELRHLDISGASMLDAEEMPVGIGKLRKLQTLRPYFFIGHKSGHRIRDLENLDCLSGSLSIMHLQNVKRSEDAEKARLSEKSHLELLEMHWQDEGLEITTEVVNQLQPPESLQELKLYGYIGLAFPTWLGNSSFNKMVVTRLSGCSRCKHLPPLGQLPSLKKLVVEHMSGITTVGLELYGAGCLSPFPSLKILNFENMENWEKWLTLTPNNNNNRAFPCLEELKISSCPMLQGDIPPYLPLLKRLKIKECNVMKVSLPSSHMLQTLNIYKCQELRSIEPVICCSKRMILSNIASFCGVEGIWVPDLGVLLVGNKDPVETDVPTFSGNLIALVACPKLLSWQPDVYGDLNRLTYVGLNNCATMAAFMERKFPSSVKHLSIEGYDSIRHVSTLTKGSTCLEKLYIQNCSSLITVNNLPLTLQVLCIQDVEIEQPAKAWELHLLTSLKLLKIMNAGSCVDSVESISSDSDGLHLPSSLIKINIIGFKFLKFMSCSTFPKLTNLWIQNCPLMTIECIHNSYGFSFRGKDARGRRYIHCHKY